MKLRGVEKIYCQQLVLAGTANTSEESISVGVKIPYHFLRNHGSKFGASETSCVSRCFENRYCLLIAHITNSNECHFYDDKKRTFSRVKMPHQRL